MSIAPRRIDPVQCVWVSPCRILCVCCICSELTYRPVTIFLPYLQVFIQSIRYPFRTHHYFNLKYKWVRITFPQADITCAITSNKVWSRYENNWRLLSTEQKLRVVYRKTLLPWTEFTRKRACLFSGLLPLSKYIFALRLCHKVVAPNWSTASRFRWSNRTPNVSAASGYMEVMRCVSVIPATRYTWE